MKDSRIGIEKLTQRIWFWIYKRMDLDLDLPFANNFEKVLDEVDKNPDILNKNWTPPEDKR